jgi:hypothetical protein
MGSISSIVHLPLSTQLAKEWGAYPPWPLTLDGIETRSITCYRNALYWFLSLLTVIWVMVFLLSVLLLVRGAVSQGNVWFSLQDLGLFATRPVVWDFFRRVVEFGCSDLLSWQAIFLYLKPVVCDCLLGKMVVLTLVCLRMILCILLKLWSHSEESFPPDLFV